MTLPVLRDDALRTDQDGFTLLLSLPWIRSLPTSSLRDLAVTIDGEPETVSLPVRDEWWYVQDRISVRGHRALRSGPHDVSVSFALSVPYLQAGPDGPLTLPFRAERSLSPAGTAATAGGPNPAGETASRARVTAPPALPEAGWTLAASAFNWTPEVIDAQRDAASIATGIVEQGVARTIEVEAGQVWRSFPDPHEDEVDALGEAVGSAGGAVSIVGASLDDWAPDGRRRTADERYAFLVPQLRAAARLGATGIRLPIGQAGPELLRRVQPLLHELDVVLFEEAQGHQTPDAAASAFDDIAAIDDPHVRVLVDISMLMPALPTTYLDRLSAAGLDPALLQRITEEWKDPATNDAVVALLRSGGVPGPAHTLYMNLLVRFGRSDAADLRPILPLVGAFHLKFWDLDDADGRVSQPIRDVGALLRTTDFTGTLCSEWGGHEWLDDDPTETTVRHLALAERALQNHGGEPG